MDAESSAGYAPVRALFGSRREETGIPYEWYRDCTTVQEINNQDVVRKPDVLHAKAPSAARRERPVSASTPASAARSATITGYV